MYLLRMKKSSGGFGVSTDGEVDARGVYCAVAVASLCNILTDEVRSGCDKFISELQTFDGGFGGMWRTVNVSLALGCVQTQSVHWSDQNFQVKLGTRAMVGTPSVLSRRSTYSTTEIWIASVESWTFVL